MSCSLLTVVPFKGGSASAITVPVDCERDTVRQLKQHIAEGYNTSIQEMKLVYRAKPLFEEDKVLSMLDITCNCTVHVVYRLHGGSPRGATEVLKQLRAARKANLHGVQEIELDPEDPMVVNIAFTGASGTPFAGRQLFKTLRFPADYPYSPPKIKFQHPIYHPNVHEGSQVLCWDDDDTTGSTYDLISIIGMVNTLMGKPNTNSPANRGAAELYMQDENEWFAVARDKARDVLFGS